MHLRAAVACLASLGLALVFIRAFYNLPSLAGRTKSTAMSASVDTRIGRALGPQHWHAHNGSLAAAWRIPMTTTTAYSAIAAVLLSVLRAKTAAVQLASLRRELA